MKRLLVITVSVVAAVPVAIAVTFLLTPLWRWIEATTGIESIGHSGPADWCFITVWAALLIVTGGVWLRAGTRPKD